MQPLKKLKLILHSKLFLASIVISAIAYTMFSFFTFHSKYKTRDHIFTGTILSISINGNQATLEIKAKEKLLISYKIPSKQSLNWIKTLELGDTVSITGDLEIPSKNRNFHLFNYQNYLKGKQIYWTLKAQAITLQKKATGLYRLKNTIRKRIQKSSNRAYLMAFILGDNKDLEWKNKYQELGISHLFAVSGMHIVFLTTFLFSFFKQKQKLFSFFIVAGILSVYIWFLQDSASANRAFLLFLFVFFNKYYKLGFDSVQLLLIVFAILLFKNPFVILQIGFQFSFIICFFLMIQKQSNENHYLKNLFWTSVLALIVSFPLSSFHFYQFHFGAVLINVFAVPFVSFLLFPLSFFTFFIPFLNPILTFFIQIFHCLLTFFEIFSFLKLTFAFIPIYFLGLYYIILLLCFLTSKKWFIVFFMLLIFHFICPYINNHYYLDMIDIGQGDAILIRYPHLSKSILIDTGGFIFYQKEEWQQRKRQSQVDTILLPYLKSLGITKIDTLIITHGDYDHIGNAYELVSKFLVKNIIMNSGNNNQLETDLISLAKEKRISVKQVSKSNIKIGNHTFQFLNSKNENNENDDSLIIHTTLAHSHILFMGDAEENSENILLQEYQLPKMDILKVGHHGSKTSTTPNFLDIVRPSVALISAGVNNSFGHPHKEVLEALSKKRSKVYTTKQQGSIRIQLGARKIKTCVP